MRRLLVLRPEPGASETVARARQRGFDVSAVPLFKAEPVPWEAPDARAFDGLMLTSANALRHGGKQLECLRGLSVYAVGEATAEAARKAGFEVRLVGDSGADELLESIDANLNLLHLCGEDRRDPLRAPQNLTSVPVYRAMAIDAPELNDIATAVALIHSPRAARRFAELVHDRASIALAAISEAAAEEAGSGWQVVEAASQPTDDALLALAARLCDKPPPK